MGCVVEGDMAGQCNATLDCSFDYDNLGCDDEPSPCDFDITSLTYCDSARECPCGLKHCHHLQTAFFAGYRKKGVCTPPIKACVTVDDCVAVGDVHTMGKVGVRCKNNVVTNKKECH